MNSTNKGTGRPSDDVSDEFVHNQSNFFKEVTGSVSFLRPPGLRWWKMIQYSHVQIKRGLNIKVINIYWLNRFQCLVKCSYLYQIVSRLLQWSIIYLQNSLLRNQQHKQVLLIITSYVIFLCSPLIKESHQLLPMLSKKSLNEYKLQNFYF